MIRYCDFLIISVFEAASRFETSGAYANHKLCHFLCPIVSPYKIDFLLPKSAGNKSMFIYIIIKFLTYFCWHLRLQSNMSFSPGKECSQALVLFSGAHWNSLYAWICWFHFCLKPAGKTQFWWFCWGHTDSEPILSHCISKNSITLNFSGLEQKKEWWAYMFCARLYGYVRWE